MRIFGSGWEEQVLTEFRTYGAAAERVSESLCDELGDPLSIIDSPCRIRKGLSPSNECALPGAHRKSRSALPSLTGFSGAFCGDPFGSPIPQRPHPLDFPLRVGGIIR